VRHHKIGDALIADSMIRDNDRDERPEAIGCSDQKQRLLTLWNTAHLHLNLRQRQNVRASCHITQDIRDRALGAGSSQRAEGADHEVRQSAVGIGAAVDPIAGPVWDTALGSTGFCGRGGG